MIINNTALPKCFDGSPPLTEMFPLPLFNHTLAIDSFLLPVAYDLPKSSIFGSLETGSETTSFFTSSV